MLHFFSGEVLYPEHVNFYEAEIIFQDLFFADTHLFQQISTSILRNFKLRLSFSLEK